MQGPLRPQTMKGEHGAILEAAQRAARWSVARERERSDGGEMAETRRKARRARGEGR